MTLHFAAASLALIALSTQALAAEPMPPNPALPTLWIVGDSTVHQTGKTLALFSWGDLIHSDFDQAKLNVVNRARGGRSSRTFITEGLWDSTVSHMKPGDFLFIQMGHNDASPVVDADRCRGSLPGTGDETQSVANNVRHDTETVHTFGWYMRKMVNEAKAKGATVIIFSPVPRAPKADATQEAGKDSAKDTAKDAGKNTAVAPRMPSTEATNYTEWAADVATQTGSTFINLNQLIWTRWSPLTTAQIKADYFTAADGTHSSGAGARLNTQCVLDGLRALKPNPLAQYMISPNPAPATSESGAVPATANGVR